LIPNPALYLTQQKQELKFAGFLTIQYANLKVNFCIFGKVPSKKGTDSPMTDHKIIFPSQP